MLLLLLSSAVSAFAGVCYVDGTSASPAPPYTTWATAARTIQEAVDAAVPGDEIVVTNGVYATGGWAVGTSLLVNRAAVDRPLMVRSVNGPQFTMIQGYQVPGTTNGDGAIRCVYLADGASLCGFTLTNGATRTNGDYSLEQSGGGLWCESSAVVSNCVLAGNLAHWAGGGVCGGMLNHCALATNSTRFGGGAFGSTLNDCTLNGNLAEWGGGAAGGTLNHCTLSGNSASWYGGGAYESALNNSTLTSNLAQYGGGVSFCMLNHCTLNGNLAEWYGGGALEGTLNNCMLSGNSAADLGGGACASTLNHCTLTGNSAVLGGGAGGHEWFGPGTLNNCIVYFNTASNGANYSVDYWAPVALNHCCTTPRPADGIGNLTNAPLFVDDTNGNLRLQSNSPCINAGLNAYAPGPNDLDGNPRIVSGTVDIGAYEFQGPGSTISYAWLQQFGLPTGGSADPTDPDADGHNTWQEWRCLTDPTNALSVLHLLSATPGATNVTVTWQSVAGVYYVLERSTNLAATPCFTPLATNLPGQPGTTTYTDTNAIGGGPFFYRVRVGN